MEFNKKYFVFCLLGYLWEEYLQDVVRLKPEAV